MKQGNLNRGVVMDDALQMGFLPPGIIQIEETSPPAS
jgi:hypothetical protein